MVRDYLLNLTDIIYIYTEYFTISIFHNMKRLIVVARRLYPVDESRIDNDTITEETVDFEGASKKTN